MGGGGTGKGGGEGFFFLLIDKKGGQVYIHEQMFQMANLLFKENNSYFA